MSKDEKYQEHEKLHVAKKELGTEQIGLFLEWLSHDGIQLARFWEHERNCESKELYGLPYTLQSKNGRYYKHTAKRCSYESDGAMISVRESIVALLARYMGIDRDKLEEEKRAMLDDARRNPEGE